MLPSSFWRLQADRDLSRFLLLPPMPLVAVKVTVMAVVAAATAATAAAGWRARWSSLSSLSDTRDCLGREVVVVEVVGPARPAALRVPCTDVLSILVNDFL